MAGSEGSPRAAAELQAPLRRCSTKRKSPKEAAAASGRMPRPRASASASTSAYTDAEKSAAGKNKNRLPAKDIRWILAQKPEAPPPTYQALKRSNPELVPRPWETEDKELCGLYVLARAFYEVEERFPKLQEWVRGELKEKGYVEVDDEWFKRTAEAQARIDRGWPSVKAKIDALWGPEEEDGHDESEEEDVVDDEDTVDAVMKDFM